MTLRTLALAQGASLAVAAIVAGCQSAPPAPSVAAGPPPAACELASFQKAPGQELVRPKKKAAPPAGKSAPLQYADPIPLKRSIKDTGTWVDAGSGWKAWRYYLHAEARSLSVHIEPFTLPPRAELWVCSPDRVTRQGPIRGDTGKYWSPDVLGPELWVEVLAPAGTEQDVTLTLAEAFAGAP